MSPLLLLPLLLLLLPPPPPPPLLTFEDHSLATSLLLAITQFNGNSDYINANFINGYKQGRFFIAGQGPVPTSFNAFWQVRTIRLG